LMLCQKIIKGNSGTYSPNLPNLKLKINN
jgi:hypothetical protein